MKTIERYQRIIDIQYALIEDYMKMMREYSGISGTIHNDVLIGFITPEEAITRYEQIENAMERIVSNLNECYDTIRYYKRKIADMKKV